MQLDKYRAFLEDYVCFLEKTADSENEKYAAMISYDTKQLSRAVSNQQVTNMHLTKMEEQRKQEQREAGLEDLTFSQILEKLEGKEKEEFSGLFRRFERAVYDIKYFNGKSMDFAQEGLQILGREGEVPAAPYDSSGKHQEGSQGSPFFVTTV